MKKIIYTLPLLMSTICFAKVDATKRKPAQYQGYLVTCSGETKSNQKLEYIAQIGVNNDLESAKVIINGKLSTNSYPNAKPKQLVRGLNYDEKSNQFTNLFLMVEQLNDGFEYVLYLGYGGAKSSNNGFIVNDDKLGYLEANGSTVTCQIKNK